jgi:hypothetical protein
VLSVLGGIALDRTGSGVPVYVAIHAVGIGAMFAWARAAEWIGSEPWRRPAPTARPVPHAPPVRAVAARAQVALHAS